LYVCDNDKRSSLLLKRYKIILKISFIKLGSGRDNFPDLAPLNDLGGYSQTSYDNLTPILKCVLPTKANFKGGITFAIRAPCQNNDHKKFVGSS